ERLLPPDAAYRLGRGISLCVLVGGMTAALVCLWCFGGGGYAYFLLFSLFMEHIITDKAAAEPVR
ncbi:MAG: hypothetical protein J6125_01830, partial [Clostridia bacterium]|nr:hypothetical protein [Clostridia bacterium]